MVLVFRRRLGRNGILSLLLLSSLRGMEGDFAFGRMLGVGKRPFQFYYPALFAFAANKEVSVADVWEPSREGGVWTPCFVRPFNDWEVEEIQKLLQAIQDKRILPNQDDLMFMKEAGDGCLSVKLLYKVLVG